MVYTSYLTVSSEVLGEFMGAPPESPQYVEDHAVKDGLQVCDVCLRAFASEVGELQHSYVEAHLRRKKEQQTDIADIDGYLKSWDEVIHPFGCWLESFPDIDVDRKFYSLDQGELFERGFRFAGKASFGEEEFHHFLSRFATGNSQGTQAYWDHVGKHILVAERAAPKELVKIRAVIFDVSIWLALNEGKSNEC
jgi:hypothetical protein